MRWITIDQLVKESGLSKRTLYYIQRDEPGILVFRDARGGGTEYKQPDCMRALFRRERDKGKRAEASVSVQDATARKILADARYSELKTARLEATLLPVEVIDEVLGRACAEMMAALMNAPSNYAIQLENAGVSAGTAEHVLEEICVELTKVLRKTADVLDAAAEALEVEDEQTSEQEEAEATAGAGSGPGQRSPSPRAKAGARGGGALARVAKQSAAQGSE